MTRGSVPQRHHASTGIAVGMLVAFLALSGCEQRAQLANVERRGVSAPPKPQKARENAEQESPALPQSQHLAEMELAILGRINAIRQKAGLGTLERNPAVARMARAYSHEMAAKHFFDHTSPTGVTLQDRFAGAHLEYTWVGENLFESYNEPDARLVDSAVEGWMKSPGHRANILRPQFTETGIGVWHAGKTYYFTQDFYRPR